MLTVKVHNANWLTTIKSLESIPAVAKSLRTANRIAILKELYGSSAITKGEYVDGLMELAKHEGFTFDTDEVTK